MYDLDNEYKVFTFAINNAVGKTHFKYLHLKQNKDMS